LQKVVVNGIIIIML